ncbi:UNVERIFIED_ORG: astacin [Methylorubrum zatmanii]
MTYNLFGSVSRRALALMLLLPLSEQGGAAENPIQPETIARPADFGETKSLRVEADGKEGKITYYTVKGQAVAEGDIVLGTVDEVALIDLLFGADFDKMAAEKEAGNGALDNDGGGDVSARLTREIAPRAVAIKAFYGGRARRWPGGIVPYEIAGNLPSPERVSAAIEHWQAVTPIRFEQRTAANANKYPNYVRFVGENNLIDGGCSSHVGMRGGRQDITIDSVCSLGNVIHEIGHAVGLQHEQTRSDRDKYVFVNWSNIHKSLWGNFQINTKENSDIGGYEYASLMHYPRHAFAIDPSIDTITPLHGGMEIGQRDSLSSGDIAAVNRLYK